MLLIPYFIKLICDYALVFISLKILKTVKCCQNESLRTPI